MEHFFDNIEGWSQMSDQGELLFTVLNNLDSRDRLRIAEIGVYKGRMTAMWNVILINKKLLYEYKATDHFQGSSEHEKGIDYYNSTVRNLMPLTKENRCLEIITNDSLSEAARYPNRYFDIVYIDAAHEYDAVKADIAAWLPKVKAGGIICGDDYVPGWPDVVRAVDEAFPTINRVGGQQWWTKRARSSWRRFTHWGSVSGKHFILPCFCRDIAANNQR
jgi:hypothetical protein